MPNPRRRRIGRSQGTCRSVRITGNFVLFNDNTNHLFDDNGDHYSGDLNDRDYDTSGAVIINHHDHHDLNFSYHRPCHHTSNDSAAD